MAKPLPARAPTGQTYGEAGAQIASQQAVPMAAAPLPPATPFDAPTTRPNEPVQAGMAMGPGPGPEVLNTIPTVADETMYLRMLYQMYPNGDLADLLEDADNDVTF